MQAILVIKFAARVLKKNLYSAVYIAVAGPTFDFRLIHQWMLTFQTLITYVCRDQTLWSLCL